MMEEVSTKLGEELARHNCEIWYDEVRRVYVMTDLATGAKTEGDDPRKLASAMLQRKGHYNDVDCRR